MSNKRFVFLVNPISGTVKKQGVLELIKKEADVRKLSYEIISTRADGNYSELKKKLVADGITHVVMVGGDGTVNTVVNDLRELPLKFGVIPMGSGNGLALAA